MIVSASHMDPPMGTATRAVFGTAVTNAVLAGVALITGVLAARLLGPEARGHLAAAQVVGSFIAAFGSLSLGESLVYFVGRRQHPPWVVLKTAALVATASTCLLIVVGVLAMPSLLSGQPASISPARVYLFVGLSFVLFGFPVTYVRALQHYRLWNILRTIPWACWLLTLMAFALTERRDVVSIVLVFVVLQLLFVPLVWIMTKDLAARSVGVDLTLVRPMLRYGTPLLIATLPHALNLRLDQLLIANAQTAKELGLYAVSVSWAGLGLPLMGAVGAILFPRLAGLEETEAHATLGRFARAGVLIAVVIGSVSAVSGPFLVPFVFGEDFAVPLLLPVVLAMGTSVLGLNGILEEGIRGLGDPRSVLMAELIGLVGTVVLLFLLLPKWGILGAAGASLIGYMAVTVVLSLRTKRTTGLGVSDLLLPNTSDLRVIAEELRGLRRHSAG